MSSNLPHLRQFFFFYEYLENICGVHIINQNNLQKSVKGRVFYKITNTNRKFIFSVDRLFKRNIQLVLRLQNSPAGINTYV